MFEMYRSRLLETVVVNRCLLLTLVVALAVRLILAVAVQAQVDRPPARLCLIAGDAEGYWELAQNILAGKDFSLYQPPRFVSRVPGFPILLALSHVMFGESPFAARCLLACVGTAACGFTYWLGRIIADHTVGLLAALYTALSPTLALFSVLILSETLFAAALLLSLIAIAKFVPVPNASPEPSGSSDSTSFLQSFLQKLALPFAAGVLIGVTTLVRPTWLYVGFAIALVTVCAQFPRSSLRQCGFCLTGIGCGIVISMAPWTIRNYEVTGHVVPTTLWVGASLYDGLHPAATGDSDMQFFEDDRLLLQMSEYDVDREYRRRAWDYAARNPGRAVWLAMKKQQRYWSLVPNAAQFQDWRMKLVVCVAALPLLIFGVCGAWVSRRNLAVLALTAGPILLFAALHLLFVGSLRYRLPAEYPFAVLAAIGLKSLFLQAFGTRSVTA
jgi:4-amino-4-deoxy-L-arabinose transferase-like glycosyltransferase